MNWSDCLIVAGLAAATALLTVPVICRLCLRHGILDMPGEHKRHRFPTPNLGGIAIFLGFWIAVLYALYHYHGLRAELHDSLYYVVAGGIIIFVVGLVDDLSRLSAPVKMASQVIAGTILYIGGLKITHLFVPFIGPMHLGVLSLPITLLWIVGVTNSINLIDGLDGLAAGVSAIAALAILFVGIYFQLYTVIVFTCAIIGACLVFLYFNHYPAQIFMGDNGSLFLGYLFAVISIIFPIKSYTTAAVFVPMVALGVPIIETIVSFIRRTVSGEKFYRADNRHLFHYLAASGLSKSQVVWLFYLVSAAFAISAGAMCIFDRRLVFTILAVFMVVIFGVLLRFHTTPKKHRED